MSLRFDDEPAISLEQELVEVAQALEDAGRLAASLEPDRAEAVAIEETVVAEREALLSPDAGGVDPVVKRAGEVRRELAALRSGLERSGGEVGRLTDRQGSLHQRLTAIETELAGQDEASGDADEVEDQLARAVQHAQHRRTESEAELTEAEEALRDVQGNVQGHQARVEVLTAALDAARARAGAARLAELDGVIGTLLDAIDIDLGWEAAFEAAAGEALTAVVVADVDVARSALELLAGSDRGGAVLAARDAAADTGAFRVPGPSTGVAEHHAAGGPAEGATFADPDADDADAGTAEAAGDAAHPGAGTAMAAGDAGEPIRRHVRGRTPAVDSLLDGLLARAVRVEGGWAAALGVAVRHPHLVVVTDQGDRFGPQGWRVGTAGTGVTGAMLEDARLHAEAAVESVAPARARLEAARQSARSARSALEAAVRAGDEQAAQRRAVLVARERNERSRVDLQREGATVAAQLLALEERNERERRRLGELDALLPSLEAAERDEAARAEARAAAEADLDRRRSEAGRRRMELEVESAQANQRVQLLTERRREIEHRRELTRRSREETDAERGRAAARLVVLGRLEERISVWSERMDAAREELQAERRRLSDAAREVGRRLDAFRQQHGHRQRSLAGTARGRNPLRARGRGTVGAPRSAHGTHRA